MPSSRQVLVAHASPILPAVAIRSTVLQSSVTYLRERGHLDRYLTLIDPAYRATVVESLAPSWLPIAAGLAHYEACDALELDRTEMDALGRAVGNRIQNTFLSTLLKTASAVVTPLRVLPRLDIIYGRLIQGGSVQVVQTGPKDIELEMCASRIMRHEYCREALAGIIRAGFACIGVQNAHVRIASYSPSRDAVLLRMAWV